VDQLAFAVLSIPLVIMVERVGGILGWLSAFIVSAIYAVFGTIHFVTGLLPFLWWMLSNTSRLDPGVVGSVILLYLSPLLSFVLGSVNLFYTLTSESLNRHLGTDPIFTAGKSHIAKSEEKGSPEESVAEEVPDKLVRQVPSDLKDAVLWLDERKYNTVAMQLATVIRRKTLDRLGLVESSTNDEIVARLSELGLGVNLEMLSYVLNLGERCAFAKYQPTEEEAGKALEYSIELYSELST